MADLAASVATARKAGYSDQQIADFIANDPSMGVKVKAARAAGYDDAAIVGHLATSAKSDRALPMDYGRTSVSQAPNPVVDAFRQAKSAAGDAWNTASAALGRDVSGALSPAGARNPVGAAGTVALDAINVPFSAAVAGTMGALQPALRGHYADEGDPNTAAANKDHPFFMDPNHVTTRQDLGNLAGDVVTGLIPLERPAKIATTIANAGVRAARSGAEAIARPVADSAVAARFSRRAAEGQAARTIASEAHDLPAVRAAVEDGPTEIIPGSQPTSYEQTADRGIGGLQRARETANPEPYIARRADQNTARVAALDSMRTGGDPADVSKLLREQFDAADAEHAAAADQATSAGQASVTAAGGQAAPEAIAEQIRGPLASAESASKSRYGALYDAIDPKGDLTANTTAASKAAADIAAEIGPTTAPMSGIEADIFARAQAMPAVAPAKQLVDLRQYVVKGISEEREGPGFNRLNRLKAAIDDNLANSVSERVASDQAAVARGEMAPDDAAGARLQAEFNDWQQRRVEARSAVGGVDAPASTGRASALPGADRAEVSTVGRSGTPAGGPGVSPDAGVPTFDAEAADRLKAANAAYSEHRTTFDAAPVASVVDRSGRDFTLPAVAIPDTVFIKGPKGLSNVQAVLKASPDALPGVEEAAAMSLRRAALTPDGIIDPKRFATWRAAHQDALRALPEATQARFADAAAAGQAVLEARQARALMTKEAQRGALARVMGATDADGVTRTIAGMLNSRTASQDMRALVARVKNDPNALAGLRQAINDHVRDKLMSNTEVAASGTNEIKADAFMNFVKHNRAALREVMTQEELQLLSDVALDLRRGNRSVKGTGLSGRSTTAQDRAAAAGGKQAKSMLNWLISAMGAGAGSTAGPIGAGVGSAAGSVLADGLKALSSQGISRVDGLIDEALLDPARLRILLRKVPEGSNGAPQAEAFNARMKALIRTLQGTLAVKNEAAPTQPQPVLPADYGARQ